MISMIRRLAAKPALAADPLDPADRRAEATLIRRLLPQSLLARALMIIFMPLLMLQVIATSVFYEGHWETVTQRLADAVAGDIAVVVDLIARRPDAAERALIIDEAARRMQIDVTFVPARTLPVLPVLIPPNLVDDKLSTALRDEIGRPFQIDSRSLEKEVQVQIQLDDGLLDVFIPRRRLFSSTTYVFILWMLGASIGLFGIATIFMRNQIRPIARLASAADAFGKGQDEGDFRIEGATEVRRAAIAFTRMRDRIRRQIAQRTEMLAGVSHDLRTPLTRMRLQLAMLPPSEDVTGLRNDIQDMERMIEGYLAFARGEGAESAMPTDLVPLVRDIIDQAARGGSSAALILPRGERIRLTVRQNALRRCLTNLLENARRHADKITVTVTRQGNIVEILVDDDGPGIPQASRQDVFKPFFQLQSGAGPNVKGHAGLGLTIARDVMRSHGGDLLLDNSPLGGLRARLRFPV